MSREKWLWKIAGRKESGQIIEYSLDAMRFFLLITGVVILRAAPLQRKRARYPAPSVLASLQTATATGLPTELQAILWKVEMITSEMRTLGAPSITLPSIFNTSG